MRETVKLATMPRPIFVAFGLLPDRHVASERVGGFRLANFLSPIVPTTPYSSRLAPRRVRPDLPNAWRGSRQRSASCGQPAARNGEVRKGGRNYDRPEPSPIKAAVSEVGLEWAQNRVPRGASEGTQTRNTSQSGVAVAPRTFIFPGAVFRSPNRGAKMDPASSAG